MKFTHQLTAKRQYMAVALMVLTSISFYGCKAGDAVCTTPCITSTGTTGTACEKTTPDTTASPSLQTGGNEADYSRGPMNEEASLPMHMTE